MAGNGVYTATPEATVQEVPLHRRPRVRRALTVLGVVYLAGSVVWAVTDAAGWWERLSMLALGVIATSCCLLAMRRRGADHAAVLLAVAAVAAIAMHGLRPYTGYGILYFVPWVGAFRARLWQAAMLTAASMAGFVAVGLGQGLQTGEVFGTSVGLLSALVFAVVLQQLIVAWEQAKATTREHARRAVVTERAHVARELHDILAHALSAQIAHLESAQLLLERGGDTRQVQERVARAGQLARMGLDETRRVFGALRGHDGALIDHLQRLAADFRATTGACCEVAITGDPAGLGPEARLAVARTAQEALTNVGRHAHGADVTLTMRCQEQWCELDLVDTGGTSSEFADVGSGYGLIGMRERAELLGGTLHAGRDGAGFWVSLRVPT